MNLWRRPSAGSGCDGDFYNAAPKVGATGNLLEEMWLSGGALHATSTAGYSPEYTGTLNADGSFQLVWDDASPNGERNRIDGVISADGTHITGTCDAVFTSGCLNHFQITEGHFLSGGDVTRFPDAPVR